MLGTSQPLAVNEEIKEDEIIEQIPVIVPPKEEEVSEEDKQKLEEATQKVSKSKGKKKKWFNLLFLLINLVIVALILVNQAQQEEGVLPFQVLWSQYLSFDKLMMLAGIWIAVMIFETLKFAILIYDSTKRHRLFLAYKVAAIGRYYDVITPMGSGGQPFEVFYLKAHGLTSADSLSVTLGRYVFGQICFVLLGIIVSISSASSGATTGSITQNVVSAASWIGIFLNAALIFLVAFLSFSKKLSRKVISGILTLLQKMKIIKNREKYIEKVNHLVGDFQSAFKTYAKNKSTLILSFLFSLAQLVLNYTIPFVIYVIFEGYDPTIWWQLFVVCMMVDFAVSFLPVPGGTGASEISFAALMATLFSSGMLFWAIIFWRILTFYIYLVQGPIIMAYDYIWGNKRTAWMLRKWQLEEESKNATVRQQISMFDKKKTLF